VFGLGNKLKKGFAAQNVPRPIKKVAWGKKGGGGKRRQKASKRLGSGQRGGLNVRENKKLEYWSVR